MIRIDKYVANLWNFSRKEVAKLVKNKLLFVNGELVKKPDFKVKIWDTIKINNEEIKVLDDITIILHKPANYISSDIDEWNYISYKNLLTDCPYKWMVKVAWRLDVDTEWLLLLLSDGKKIHQIISPKKEKEKIYYVQLEKDISDEDIKKLETGIEFENYTSKPAKVLKIENNLEEIQKFGNFKKSTLEQIPLNAPYAILISIIEWKFHQVKNMLNAVKNKVIYLKRLKVWEYELENLKKWERKIIGNLEIVGDDVLQVNSLLVNSEKQTNK